MLHIIAFLLIKGHVTANVKNSFDKRIKNSFFGNNKISMVKFTSSPATNLD
jgi:hypothetical protein